MKRTFLTVYLIYCISILAFCQDNNGSENINFKFEKPAIVFFNGNKIDVEHYSDSTLSIGMVLHNNIYKSDGPKSIFENYINTNKPIP